MSNHSENCYPHERATTEKRQTAVDDTCANHLEAIKALQDDETLSSNQLNWAMRHFGLSTRPTTQAVSAALKAQLTQRHR
jgi:hypothetical protein